MAWEKVHHLVNLSTVNGSTLKFDFLKCERFMGGLILKTEVG